MLSTLTCLTASVARAESGEGRLLISDWEIKFDYPVLDSKLCPNLDTEQLTLATLAAADVTIRKEAAFKVTLNVLKWLSPEAESLDTASLRRLARNIDRFLICHYPLHLIHDTHITLKIVGAELTSHEVAISLADVESKYGTITYGLRGNAPYAMHLLSRLLAEVQVDLGAEATVVEMVETLGDRLRDDLFRAPPHTFHETLKFLEHIVSLPPLSPDDITDRLGMGLPSIVYRMPATQDQYGMGLWDFIWPTEREHYQLKKNFHNGAAAVLGLASLVAVANGQGDIALGLAIGAGVNVALAAYYGIREDYADQEGTEPAEGNNQPNNEQAGSKRCDENNSQCDPESLDCADADESGDKQCSTKDDDGNEVDVTCRENADGTHDCYANDDVQSRGRGDCELYSYEDCHLGMNLEQWCERMASFDGGICAQALEDQVWRQCGSLGWCEDETHGSDLVDLHGSHLEHDHCTVMHDLEQCSQYREYEMFEIELPFVWEEVTDPPYGKGQFRTTVHGVLLLDTRQHTKGSSKRTVEIHDAAYDM